MDELIGRVSARLGVDRETAERAVAIVLGLVRRHGDREQVDAMFARLPGAEALAEAGAPRGGGLFAALPGGPMMAAAAALKAAGLDLEQSRTLGRELLGFAEERCGKPLITAVARSIPGFSSFV